MKLFECADGALINPFHVCFYEVSGLAGVAFYFSGSTKVYQLESKEHAEAEVEAFKKHFENEMKL